MGDTWTVDMSHFDYKEEDVSQIPVNALRLWEYFGLIVKQTVQRAPIEKNNTGIQCRRRPNKIRCNGVIQSELNTDETELNWWCPVCSDNGYISGWINTRWDVKKDEKKNIINYSKLMELERKNNSEKVIDSLPDDDIIVETIDGKINCDDPIEIKIKEGCINEINLPAIKTKNKLYNWFELGKELLTYEGFKIEIKIKD